jgi:extracellular elastinolytic metalloproteinase
VALIPLSGASSSREGNQFVTPIRNRTLAVAAISSTVLAVSMLGLPSQAATSGKAPQVHASNPRGSDATVRSPGYYDVRRLSGTALVKSNRQLVAQRTKADKAYYRSLGNQAVVSMDPLTHTARDFGRLDGYLTGRSSAPARSIAINYVRSHAGALGLKKSDLATFRFRQDYVDASGVHNLSWNQSVRGATVFGNGLKVKVTRDGHVLAVQGSPVSGLAKLAAAAPAATKVSASAARSTAARNVGGSLQKTAVRSSRTGSSTWANNDFAKRVWFLTPHGLRPGWSTYVQTSRGAFQHVVDAVTGKVLFRHSNSDFATGDALVYDNYPGASKGGKAKTVNLVKKGWIGKNAPWLKGTSAWTWADINDDNARSADEKTPLPGTKNKAQFPLVPFDSSGLCSARFVCTWDPDTAFSWQTNMKADATQAFYLASNFHDYLAQPPISFTKVAGNFETAGGDQVLLNALDGANTNAGLPDGNHIDNANMSTPPDGISPTMQMYLWHIPGATDAQDPFVPTSSAFDASVEYHEYTHGLSNRLVIDANGNSTLNDIQAGAMGEAWSDYYAMDYLVTKGFVKDTAASGEVLEGKYLMANQAPFRTMAIDCAVGNNVANCRNSAVHNGGYTYGDFPNIGGGPEVHASGEVWAQTLWDIRKRFGHTVADTLITRGMSLSADDPSMLDMRDAILRADLVKYDRSHTAALWSIFANRGMGFFAGAIDAADTTPGEDFHRPPVGDAHDGVVAGTVTDPTTGDPVQGAVVQVTGQGDQYTATTDADGFYAIFGLVTGTYAKVAASGPGYIGDAKPGKAVSINDFTAGDVTDFSIIRDWAAATGGGAVADFDGPDFTPFGCGPSGAIDLSLSTGWGSTTGNDNGDPTNVFIPKTLTIQLPQAVDISTFGVDPTATCGDGGSASTGAFSIETSPDGTTFTEAATGAFTAADRGHLNTVDLAPGTGTGIQFVRFTMLGNQTPNFPVNCPNGAFSGCSFTDLTELAVFGSPAAP